MDTRAAFHIGDHIVYPMHGMGRIDDVCLQMIEDQPQRCYRLVFAKTRGAVLVPVASAKALGLRHVLQASQVPQVLQQVQQAATQPVTRGQVRKDYGVHYAWCKARLRQGDAFGLAEVWRFLHDLEQVKTIPNLNLQLRYLRDCVHKQLPAEIASALHCTHAVARHLLTTALTSERPVVLPSAAAGPRSSGGSRDHGRACN